MPNDDRASAIYSIAANAIFAFVATTNGDFSSHSLRSCPLPDVCVVLNIAGAVGCGDSMKMGVTMLSRRQKEYKATTKPHCAKSDMSHVER